MSEEQLNELGLYVEPYAGGFMIADYRNGEDARYYGSDLFSRRQPITHCPFPDKASAIVAAEQI
jgi:hypothetical protein